MKSEINPDFCQSSPIELFGESYSTIPMRDVFRMVGESVTEVIAANKKTR